MSLNSSHQRMSRNKHQSEQNASYNSIKTDQMQDLMESIENKLSMIVGQDFPTIEPEPQVYQINNHILYSIQKQPQKSVQQADFIFVNEQKTAQRNKKMQLHELQTSYNAQQNQKTQSSGLKQSRVLHRINQMEEYYMKQVKELAYQVTFLQNENQRLRQENKQLVQANQKLEIISKDHDFQFKNRLNNQMDKIKDSLLTKFANEAQMECQKYFKEMNLLKQQLAKEKNRRKTAEDENDILKAEKETLEQFYRQLLDNHKKFLQLDISLSQQKVNKSVLTLNSSKPKTEVVVNKRKSKHESSSQVAKKKERSLILPKETKKSLEEQYKNIDRDELIPILAQGIEELKQKLNLK